MRLTLRTLLAYLDDILEPEDREALGKKIEESEFAKSLVERTGSVIGNPQLGAPSPVGRGLGRDPNSVAEYLDNTMAPEQIQEFERICLESDINLAEVTSSHRVLTMVLGEPVQFDAASRERMYRLIDGKPLPADEPAATAGAPTSSAVEEADQPPVQTVPPPTTSVATESVSAAVEPTPPADSATEPAMAAATASGTGPSAAVMGEDPDEYERLTTVPEYLRKDSRSRFWPLALTALVAAIVTGGLLVALDPDFASVGQTDGGSSGETGKGQPAEPAGDGTNGDGTPAPIDGVPAPGTVGSSGAPPIDPTTLPGTDGVPETPGNAVPADTVPGTGPATIPDGGAVIAPPDGGVGPDTVPDGGVAPDGGVVPDGGLPPGPDVGGPIPPDDSSTAGGPDGGVVEPATPPDGGQPLPPATDGGSGESPPDRVASIDPPPIDPGPGATPPPEERPPVAAVMGRLLSGDQVLLARETGGGELRRLAVQSTLNAGQTLIVLPTFRPMISLVDTTIEIDSGTMIELTGLDPNGVPEITVHYGRLVARALSVPNAGIRLRLGDQEGVVTLQDASALVGIEVRPVRTPGSDPEKVPASRAVDLYASSGNVAWTNADGQQMIQAGVRRILSPHPHEQPQAAAAAPAWLGKVQVSALDERAVPWIEQGIRSDRSVKLSLAELADHQRTEIRRVAMRCCAHIGYFDPLIKSLNDPEMRPRWSLYIPELRAAVAVSPQNAAKVRETFERLRGQDGFDLYRMLWGYGRTGLTKGGEAAQLVGFLDHDALDYRVLSFWNLQDITGLGLNYRPEYPEIKRRQSINRWQDRLQREEIVPEGSGPADTGSPS